MTRKLFYGILGASLAALSLHADTIDVQTGPSAQTLIEFGQGPLVTGSGTFGTYDLQQGSCTPVGGETVCTLSGALTAGGSAGFTSGTYAFVTTFATSDIAPIQAITSTVDPGSGDNFFFYSAFAPDLSMVLDLTTPDGVFNVPIFTNGTLDPGISALTFNFTGDVCSGTPVATCSPANVGLTPGAILSTPVTIAAAFDSTVSRPPSRLPVVLLLTVVFAAAWAVRKRLLRSFEPPPSPPRSASGGRLAGGWGPAR